MSQKIDPKQIKQSGAFDGQVLTWSNSANTYQAASTFASTHTFQGNSAALATAITNMAEPITVSNTQATGTINFDVTTQSIIYYTNTASANWTLNFRASSTTPLNNAVSTGQAITAVFMATQGATAYFSNTAQIDGSSVTLKWQGGSAPTSGNANSVDIYSYTIIKTANATYTVLASQTKFA